MEWVVTGKEREEKEDIEKKWRQRIKERAERGGRKRNERKSSLYQILM